MGFKVHNGSSLVDYTTFKVHNGSSWVDPTSGKIFNGSSWVEFLISAQYNAAFTAGGGGQDSGFALISLNTDGTTTLDGDFGQTFSSWVEPNIVASQKSHWVKASNVTGATGFYSGPALNTWHQLNVTRSWDLNGGSSASYEFDLEIALDSNGNTVVAQGTCGLTISVA